jgi:hypothetical protein
MPESKDGKYLKLKKGITTVRIIPPQDIGKKVLVHQYSVSKSVQRRRALQRAGQTDELFEQWCKTLPTAALSGTPLVRFRREHLRACWDVAYRAGRMFQFIQIQRLMCKACMDNHPLIYIAGVPLHDVPTTDGVWRKTCDAAGIYAFKP